jgi:RHS repeat-associated protein
VVTDKYEYDAYGNSFTKQGTTPNNYLYRGEQYDSDLGLYYLRARYYNPSTGRFLSRDPEDGTPTDPQSLHKYLYAGGDPVNRIDPRGREDEDEGIGLTAFLVTEVAPKLFSVGCAIAGLIASEAELLDHLSGTNTVWPGPWWLYWGVGAACAIAGVRGVL